MSLFTALEKDVKSLASKIEAAFIKLFNEEPKIEQVALSTISAVAPIVVAIAAVTGGEVEAAAIAGVVTLVKSDLAVVQVTLTDAGAGTNTTSVKSLLAAIDKNLASLLTVGMIKNPDTLAKVTKDVQTITSALEVLISAL